MTRSKTSLYQRLAHRLPPVALSLAGAMLVAAPAFALDAPAHTIRPGFGQWWLPYNYSRHGGAIDGLFSVIFWLTTIVMIVVEVTLVVFLFKYRRDPNRTKGKFIHGNSRLEMIWTLIPAVILAVLALASKGVWDRYRYGDENLSPTQEARIMVIGEQFKWNFIYPGKDHQLGQYMAFPHSTDPEFRDVKPKDLKQKVKDAINENPLGQNKDWTNAAAKFGEDDDYDIAPGRPLVLPVKTPISITLSSKDVIHDFFLPNFRVKLDALPGMAGRIDFTAEGTAQSTEEIVLDKLHPKFDSNKYHQLFERAQRYAEYQKRDAEEKERAQKENRPAKSVPALFDEQPFLIWVDNTTKGAILLPNAAVSQVNYALNGVDAQGNKVQLESRKSPLTLSNLVALENARVQTITVITRPFELVCEELCGQGHSGMQASVYFVSPEQYKAFIEKPPVTDSTTNQPAVTRAATQPVPVASTR